jgi:hypothetical protein
MRSRGQEIDRIEAYGALAVLYDLRSRPPPPVQALDTTARLQIPLN